MNILQKANEIVNLRSEEKEREYGDFINCMKKTAVIASEMSNKQISIEDAYNVLIALKLARQANKHKEDNLLDAVAYIGSLNNYQNLKNE
jgi:predicted nucleic acid-binding protein